MATASSSRASSRSSRRPRTVGSTCTSGSAKAPKPAAGSGVSSCPVTTPAAFQRRLRLPHLESFEQRKLLSPRNGCDGRKRVLRHPRRARPRRRGGDDDLLYDARVNGYNPRRKPPASGTGCQGVPPAPPIFATPASVTFTGTRRHRPLAAPTMKPKVETKAEKLAKALKVCHKHKKKSKRVRAKRQRRRSTALKPKSLRTPTGGHPDELFRK